MRQFLVIFSIHCAVLACTGIAGAQEYFEKLELPSGGRIDAVAVTDAGTPLGVSMGDIWRYDGATSQWENVQRLLGSSVNTKRIVIGSDGTTYVLTVGAGVWTSVDNGETWDLLSAAYTYMTDVHPTNSGTIYATTTGQGFKYSTDGGQSWEGRNNGLDNLYLRSIARDAAGNLYVASSNTGIGKSTDEGMSWTMLSNSPTAVEDLLIASDGYLYAARQRAVYRTSDGGATWTETGAGLSRTVARLAEAPDGTLYALTYSGNSNVYRYDAGADSWNVLENVDGKGIGRGIAVSSDGTLYTATTRGVWSTTDHGQSWMDLRNGIHAMGIMDVTEAADGTYLIATNYQGLYRSTDDGETWGQSAAALSTEEFYAVAADPAGDLYAGGRYGSIYRSTDSGESWSEENNGNEHSNLRSLLYANTGTLYASVRAGVIASTDKGATWELMNNGLPEVQVNTVREPKAGTLIACTDGEGVFRSTDAGASWMSVHQDLASLRVTDFAQQGSTMYIATSGEAVYRSTDDGTTWSQFNAGGLSYYVPTLVMTSQGSLFAGHSWAVSILSAGNDEWVNLLPEFRTVRKIIQASDGRLLVATLVDGVFRSVDPVSSTLPVAPTLLSPADGEENTGTTPLFTWSGQSEALYYHIQISRDDAHQDRIWDFPFAASTSIRMDPNTLDTLAEFYWRLAAGSGAGLGPWSDTWSFHTGMVTHVRSDQDLALSDFALGSSPNPFTDNTQLTVTMPRRGHARLRVIDMLGRTVAQLSDAVLNSGQHRFRFSATSLPAGYYVAVLEAAGSIASHRLLLLR